MTGCTGDGGGGSEMGPLVTGAHEERCDVATSTPVSAAGATLVVDGRTRADGDPDGFWLGPTLFDHVTPEMSIYIDEIFGPVLSVVRVGSTTRRWSW